MELELEEMSVPDAIPKNCIRIRILGIENVVPTYPVAEVSLKFDIGNVTLGESEKFHITNNTYVSTEYEIVLPCDLSSIHDLNKFLSNPIIITLTETQKDVDMSKVQIVVSQKDQYLKKIKSDMAGSRVVHTTSFAGKLKSSSKQIDKKIKEKKTKVKDKGKGSKMKKAKDYFDTVPAEELNGPRTLGIAMLDLLPIFLGQTDYEEALYVRQTQRFLDQKAVAVENLPKLQTTVLLEGPAIDAEKSNILFLSLESIYNIPSLLTSNFDYQLSVLLPINAENFEAVSFENGKFVTSDEFIRYKFWPSPDITGARIESSYRIENELHSIVNKNNINMETTATTMKPKIEFNTIKRIFLDSESRNRIFKYIKEHRRVLVEIYITPTKQEESDIFFGDKRKGSKSKPRKENNSKGKESSTTNKSAKPSDINLDEPSEYLQLMAIVSVDQLMYPGINTCRIACPITTYNEYEIFKYTGVKDSIYRPKPPEVPQEEPQPKDKKGDKKKDKSGKKGAKDSKGSKGSKGSKSSKSSKKSDKSKKGKGKKDTPPEGKKPGIDLTEKLPTAPPPEPEPSKQVFNDRGEQMFLLIEIGFKKAFYPTRDFEDLSNKLGRLIQKPPKLPKYVMSSSVAQEIYNETIRELTKDMNYQYRNFVEEKKECECEHRLDFLQYLQQNGIYQTYLTSITRALATLIPEKYMLRKDDEHLNKTTKEFHSFIQHIHCDMVQQMNKVINEMIVCNINKTPHKHMIRNEQLLLYAKEATEMEEYDLAEKYYLERICCNEGVADFWFDYAIFQMETDKLDNAIQCLKEALSLDSTHRYSLFMYGMILLEKGKLTEAETCLLTMTLMHPRWALGWGGLYVYYTKTQNVEGMELSLQMANKYLDEPNQAPDHFTADDLAWSTQSCSTDVHTQVTILFIKMRLFHLAEKLLNTMSENSGSRNYLMGVVAYLSKNYKHSLEHLESTKESLGLDYGVCALIGHCFLKSNDHNDALVLYEMAFSMYNRPDDIHLVYIFAAICYDVTGNSQKARKFALLTCKYSPTPQTWLHAGSAYFKQNDFLSAEECLVQANLCDNRLPEPWAYLALVNAYLGKNFETELCLTQAKKFDTKNSQIIGNVEKMLSTLRVNE